MSVAYWALFAGLTLIAMMLIGTLLARLPLSGAMIYLGLGFLLGPDGAGIVAPDPIRHAGALELITEAALLISLFAVGLKLEVPLLDRPCGGLTSRCLPACGGSLHCCSWLCVRSRSSWAWHGARFLCTSAC
jgi:hypothetical protein